MGSISFLLRNLIVLKTAEETGIGIFRPITKYSEVLENFPNAYQLPGESVPRRLILPIGNLVSDRLPNQLQNCEGTPTLNTLGTVKHRTNCQAKKAYQLQGESVPKRLILSIGNSGSDSLPNQLQD